MVVIRLSPGGRKNQRIFRVLVADRDSKLTGKFLEKIGQYDEELKKFQLSKERFEHWLKLGAIPSSRVVKLMRDNDKGVLGKKETKKAKLRSKKASKAASAAAETPAAESAAQ
jgi:small subunit ribosomal protein S16